MQQYCTCILMHLLFPFMPFVFEWFFVGHDVEALSLTLFLALYAIAVGNTSRSVALFAVYLLIGVLAAAAYGQALNPGLPLSEKLTMTHSAWIGVCIIVASHLLDRYHRHVVEREPFFDWWPSNTASAKGEGVSK